MQNFEFKRTSRKCSKCERELRPGERFHSALLERNADLERLDFCQTCWEAGAPEESLGSWQTRLPEPGPGKVYWAPRQVLMSFFDYVNEKKEMADIAYVMALLLIQKRILAMDDSKDTDDDCLFLINRKDKLEFKVPVINVEAQRIAQIQTELEEKLFVDRPPEELESEDDSASLNTTG